MLDDQMHVLMNRRRIMLADNVLHDDVVALPAARVVRERKLVEPVWLVLFFAAESYNAHWEFGGSFRRACLQEEAADLLEIQNRLAALFLARRGEQLEMRGDDFNPLIGGG